MVLLNVGGNNLDVLVAPDRSSMNAFCRSASDDSVGLYASSGSERSAVVGFPAIYVHAGIFVLPKFGEGGTEAADLVVEVRLGRVNREPGCLSYSFFFLILFCTKRLISNVQIGARRLSLPFPVLTVQLI